MKDKKTIIAGWYVVDPKKRDRVVASFQDLLQRARRAPGCLDLAITGIRVEVATRLRLRH